MDGHHGTNGTDADSKIERTNKSFQKDILFLFSVRVCRLGILGRMTASGSKLLSKINSSKSPNTAKPSNDLQQSKSTEFLFIRHKRAKYGVYALQHKSKQINIRTTVSGFLFFMSLSLKQKCSTTIVFFFIDALLHSELLSMK